MTQPNSVRPSTLHQGIIAYVGSEIDTIYTSEIANTYPIEHSDESNTSAGIIASILNSIKIKWQSGSKRQTLEKISDEDGFKAKKLAEKFVKDFLRTLK